MSRNEPSYECHSCLTSQASWKLPWLAERRVVRSSSVGVMAFTSRLA